MEVRTAQVGFCFGIERAYSAFDKRARAGERIHVAHRAGGAWDTLRRIERRDRALLDRYPGLQSVAVAHDVTTLKDGDKLMIGFHGLADNTKAALESRGVALVEDMLCPFIAKLDRVVERLAGEGYDIAIVGKPGNHHCVVAQEFAERHGQRCYVIEGPEGIDAIPQRERHRLALVGQVTGNTVTFDAVVEHIRNARMPVRIFRTMCGDSRTRQEHAVELAKTSDVVILVDDGGGASESVFEVCSRHNARVYRVAAEEEISSDWFDGASTVAIVGGILVPEWTIEDMAERVRQLTTPGTLLPASYG
jgi:4-hydroxy-3-methylbut-2-enyl diphosphate reductase